MDAVASLLSGEPDASKAAQAAAEDYSHCLKIHFGGDNKDIVESATISVDVACLFAAPSYPIGLALILANHFLVPPIVRTIKERYLTLYEELSLKQLRGVERIEWESVKTMSVLPGGGDYEALKRSIPPCSK